MAVKITQIYWKIARINPTELSHYSILRQHCDIIFHCCFTYTALHPLPVADIIIMYTWLITVVVLFRLLAY